MTKRKSRDGNGLTISPGYRVLSPASGQRAALDAQSELIGSIYDCAIRPDGWSDTLQRICTALGGHSAGIVLLDYRAARNDRLVRDWGPTMVWGERMGSLLESIKFIHRQFLGIGGSQIDKPILLPRDLSSEVKVFETPFYQQWAAPQEIHQVLESVALSDATRLGLFCVTRQLRSGEFTPEQVSLMARLAPHIRRAITIGDLLDEQAVRLQGISGAMDSFATGFVMVGNGGEILHVNDAAAAMLETGRPIRREGGNLVGMTDRATRELLEAVALAQRNEAEIGSCGIGIGLAGPGERSAVAHVLPLARGSIRTRLRPQAMAAVFINTAAAQPFGDLKAVAAAFDFTPAETRLIAQLRDGLSLVQAADKLGIQQSTAKTHLGHIFDKVGVYRQNDVLALINRLIVPVRRPRPRSLGADPASRSAALRRG